MYNEKYLAAVTDVLHHEGGFVDHPNDPGGATAYGISLRWLRQLGDLKWSDIDGDGDVDADDIKSISQDRATELYYRHFWTPAKCEAIKDHAIAKKVFDMGVNMGNRQAWKLVQRACGGLVVDGIVGTRTLGRVNTLCSEKLLLAIQNTQRAFYLKLAERKPRLRVFLRGWINRAAYPSTPGALGWTKSSG